MSLEEVIKKTRLRMGATLEIRLARARERSRVFNERAERDLESQRMTPELLAKRCTLWERLFH